MNKMIGTVSEKVEDYVVFADCYARKCVNRLGAVLAGEQKIESGAELVEVVLAVAVVAVAAVAIVRTIMNAIESKAQSAANEINNATWK